MKKIILSFAFVLALSSVAYADGSAFTPLNFNDTTYIKSPSSSSTTSSSSYTAPTTVMPDEAIGNGNIQNAISQLDDAQLDIRNDLVNCRTKYADVDAQYKLIKAERSALKKQIRSIEKRINEIEKAKERIRNNML